MTQPNPLPPLIPGSPLALSPEHIAQFQSAHTRSKRIRRAVSVAFTDAWIASFFAACTLLFGLLDPVSFILGSALALIAFNSFRGAKRLKKFDPTAPKILAVNQLLLASVIILYSLYSLWSAAYGKSALPSELNSPDLADYLGGDTKNFIWTVSLLLYGTLIIGTILFQGLTALYYFTRKKILINYLDSTPEWIVTLQKNQVGA